MSKLIITGAENGKITYVEGEEVSISVEEIKGRILELNSKISLAKATNLEDIEKEHEEKLLALEKDFEEKVSVLTEEKELKVSAENERYESLVNKMAETGDISKMESEVAKLSLILEGLNSVIPEPEVEEKTSDEEVITEENSSPEALIEEDKESEEKEVEEEKEAEEEKEDPVEEKEGQIVEKEVILEKEEVVTPVAMPSVSPEVEPDFKPQVSQVSIPRPRRVIF